MMEQIEEFTHYRIGQLPMSEGHDLCFVKHLPMSEGLLLNRIRIGDGPGSARISLDESVW